MGEFCESLRQEAYDHHRPGPIDHFEHWIWLLDDNPSSYVLAGIGRNREWEYWSNADNDS